MIQRRTGKGANTAKRLPLVLAADIGNTSVSLGLFLGKTLKAERRVPTSETNPATLDRAIRGLLGRRKPRGAVLGSVAPPAVPRWARAMRRAADLSPLAVDCRLDFGMRLDYPAPETLGVDRLLNASAAMAAYGAPVLAVDIGTAVTFDVVDKNGAFVGGLIMPGLRLMADAMAGRTALLPALGDGELAPAAGAWRAFGRSTREAMGLGVRWMIRAAIENLREAVRRELGAKRLPCVVTGGYAAPLMAGWRHGCALDPHLTLRGLARVWALNAQERNL